MSYQQYIESIRKKEESSLDLVFVCPSCKLRMPHIPRPGGKKQCPRCGDPLCVVPTLYVPMAESAKLAEDLEKLLEEFESHSQVERLGATHTQLGSKSQK